MLCCLCCVKLFDKRSKLQERLSYGKFFHTNIMDMYGYVCLSSFMIGNLRNIKLFTLKAFRKALGCHYSCMNDNNFTKNRGWKKQHKLIDRTDWWLQGG